MHDQIGCCGVRRDARAEDTVARQPQWTEAIAVGSRAFVEAIAQTVSNRQHLDISPSGENAWVLGLQPSFYLMLKCREA
jgi:hypothetical protein